MHRAYEIHNSTRRVTDTASAHCVIGRLRYTTGACRGPEAICIGLRYSSGDSDDGQTEQRQVFDRSHRGYSIVEEWHVRFEQNGMDKTDPPVRLVTRFGFLVTATSCGTSGADHAVTTIRSADPLSRSGAIRRTLSVQEHATSLSPVVT